MGTCMRAMGYISINRQNKTSSIRSIEKAVKMVQEARASLWVAPEGTRSASGELQEFKKGPFHLALAVKAPIIPVWLENAHQMIPKGSMVFDYGTKMDVIIGSEYTRHLSQEMSAQELMQDFRKTLLELKNSFPNLMNQPWMGSHPWIGVGHCFLPKES